MFEQVASLLSNWQARSDVFYKGSKKTREGRSGTGGEGTKRIL
jgi:hypothetical protein